MNSIAAMKSHFQANKAWIHLQDPGKQETKRVMQTSSAKALTALCPAESVI